MVGVVPGVLLMVGGVVVGVPPEGVADGRQEAPLRVTELEGRSRGPVADAEWWEVHVGEDVNGAAGTIGPGRVTRILALSGG